MRYIHDTIEIRQEIPSVVTIGKFDGFHRGHQKILEKAVSLGGKDCQVVVFTFSKSPQMVLAGRIGTGLNTKEEKLALAEAAGVQVMVEYPFSQEVRRMTAEYFLEEILLKQLKVRHIVAGPDCHFGYERRGDIEFLRNRSVQGGFGVHVVEKEQYENEPISSTRIREALAAGRVEEANDMLGYAFGYEAQVVHGRKLGRTLGFPTINQEIGPDKMLPAFGVYAVDVHMDGMTRHGIANVGVKPTVSGASAAGIETSIFDFNGDLYGKTIKVELKHFVRPERRFESLDELKNQIQRDKETVLKSFKY